MDHYRTTIKTWDKLAQRYQDVFMDLNLYDQTYDAFCNLLEKKDASILELGCGPGNVTRYLLHKRLDYKIHATDAAPSMIDLAKKNNPTATFEILDLRDISELKQRYDGLVCGFCLPYIDELACKKLIQDSYQLLKKEGFIYLSMIEGNYQNSGMETSSDGQHSMFVYYYSESFIINTFEENHFTILNTFKIPYTKSNGSASTHMIFIAKKN
jgi:cyclopropane fatty-acyl-phospholipid synthase-like methyltransferase